MARKKQSEASRGSQRWMQRLVGQRSELIDTELVAKLDLDPSISIEWLSPLKDDEFSEYSDHDFLKRLGVSIEPAKLLNFWPTGGPNWDGLARTSNNIAILIEAKAHIAEMVSGASSAKSQSSIDLIGSSLAAARKYCGSDSNFDWNGPLYQYANRVAHLYFLRELHSIDAHLINIYFVDDNDMGGPATTSEWLGAITLAKTLLGLRRHKLSHYMHDVFIDVNDRR